MQINTFHKLDSAGSYEWIYFDLISEKNDYALVVILYNGFPFYNLYLKNYFQQDRNSTTKKLNSKDFPAISFCLYNKNRKVVNLHYLFPKNSLKLSDNTIRYNDNIILVKDNDYSLNLHIKLKFPYRKISISSDFRISNYYVSCNEKLIGNEEEIHFWSHNLIKYYGSVETTIENKGVKKQTISFSGIGYNDQNWGLRPIVEDVKNWYWGRFHKDDYTFIYLITENYKGNFFKHCILYKGNTPIKESTEFEMNINKAYNYFLLKYGKEIKIKCKDFFMKNVNNIKLDNGPFYIRLLSSFEIKFGNIELKGIGISEFINPPRLMKNFFTPFINLKIRYYQPSL